ncbi:MAG: lytic transglycosylase domain-containing protein [Bacillati bacterium ANGP1]|uniref:Lytic transglycosylase domain-containing protein n=1 Tax=Candidatus Segetimicrobium genomatis TaxID=2569760 RepID=A0A537J974_9BACT|nr:MAG: lytic transglycosylase domain-containing protein [Terrabacteria group bacterium ANGP1]
MKRWIALAVVVFAALGVFLYLQHTEPPWYARLWYPLRYTSIVRAHSANYDINPALLAAVIEQESKFRADAKSSAGAIGLMQLLPATAKGSTSATEPGTSGACSTTTTTTSGSRLPPTTPARRTSTTGRASTWGSSSARPATTFRR